MMAMTYERIGQIRRWTMLVTGLSCLAYAAMALGQGRPDPFLWFIPGLIGALSGVSVAVSAQIAGKAERDMAMDELHQMVASRAQQHSYWIALFLYPVFGVALWQGWTSFPVSFAAMGTLTGAAYLMLFVLYEARIS